MRVVIADDHSIVRDSLKQYVLLLDDAVQVDQAEALGQVLALSDATPPVDIILLDLKMPGMNGPSSVAEVRAAFPTTPIVIVSAVVDRDVIAEVLRCGVNGYVTKTTHGLALVNALRLVMAGETYIPAALFDHKASAEPRVDTASGTPSVKAKLSPREAEVLKRLIAGDTNRMIAAALGLQDATVKVHIRNTYRKIGAISRADAINIVLKSGGVDAWQED